MAGTADFGMGSGFESDLESPFDTEWDTESATAEEFEGDFRAQHGPFDEWKEEDEGLPTDDEEGYWLEGETSIFPLPRSVGAPFAPDPPPGSFYPVRSSDPRGGEVNYVTEDGRSVGNNAGRRFGANRGPIRRHAAIDIYARKGDEVIACQAGRITKFYGFCCGANKTSWALVVDHGNVVINYGEVDPSSLKRLGVSNGMHVAAGRTIAFIGVNPGGSSMLHFETYAPGTSSNKQWLAGGGPPAGLLDPTRYLLALTPATPSATTAGSSVRPTLKRGSRGVAVQDLQAALNAAGFPTILDGNFGPATGASVVAFQASRGLDADGIVGSKTWAALPGEQEASGWLALETPTSFQDRERDGGSTSAEFGLYDGLAASKLST